MAVVTLDGRDTIVLTHHKFSNLLLYVETNELNTIYHVEAITANKSIVNCSS